MRDPDPSPSPAVLSPVPTPRRGRRLAAVAVGSVLLAGACTSTPESSTASTEAPATSGSQPPGTAPMAGALLPVDEDAMRAVLEATADELLVPGTVALLKTPEGTFVIEYGTSAYDGGRPVSVDDHIRIGSNTKTWTGTVILQMVDEGLLALDDPVSTYRPDVPNGENITIEQLLMMRSGLFNYTTTLAMNEVLDAEPDKAWTQDELLALAFAEEPLFAPGEDYSYSNTNTILLGLIAEQLDDAPLADIFEERLFSPLGMADTSFPDITSNAIADPHPQGYMYGTNVSTLETAQLPPDELAAAQAGTLAPNDYTDSNPSWGWSAGAGITTARDLLVWAEALTGTEGTILGEERTAERIASVEPTSDQPGAPKYGWAIAKLGNMYGHTGELPGYNTFMGSDPVNGVTLIVWTNLGPEPVDGGGPAVTITRALLSLVYADPAGGTSSPSETPGTVP